MGRWFHRRDNKVRKHAKRILRGEALERREVLSGNGLTDGALAEPVMAGDSLNETVQVASQLQQAQPQVALSQQQSQQKQQQQTGRGGQGGGGQVISTLDSQETADLLHMREEEKLARDVYLKMGEKYGVTIFDNIAESEQRHMDSVKGLLDKYGLEDPVGDNPVGVFETAVFQELYDSLIARGEQSLVEAYQVGVNIEVLDIADLKEAIAATDNADIERVYGNLLAGSQNHLAAFTSALDSVALAVTSSATVVAADSAAIVGDGQSGDTCQQQLQTQDRLQDCDTCEPTQQQDRARDKVFDKLGDQTRDRLRDQTCIVTDALVW